MRPSDDEMERNGNLSVASLFCGCCGSDLGLLGGFTYLGRHYPRLAFDIAFAVDFDKHAVETYNRNFAHPALCADVADVDFRALPDADLLVGGFPCQSFSTVNPTKDTNDDRANLYRQIVRFLDEKRPRFFICENVKGLLQLQGGAIIRKIACEFEEQGYDVQYRLLRAVEFGIPQRRERVFIVGARKDVGLEFAYPEPTHGADEATPLRAVIDRLDIEDRRYYFSQRAVEGMKNAKNNMKRGLWQDLGAPCLTITHPVVPRHFRPVPVGGQGLQADWQRHPARAYVARGTGAARGGGGGRRRMVTAVKAVGALRRRL